MHYILLNTTYICWLNRNDRGINQETVTICPERLRITNMLLLIEKTWPYFPYSYTNGTPLTLQRLLLAYSDVSERTGGFVPYEATSFKPVSLSPEDGVSRSDRCL